MIRLYEIEHVQMQLKSFRKGNFINPLSIPARLRDGFLILWKNKNLPCGFIGLRIDMG